MNTSPNKTRSWPWTLLEADFLWVVLFGFFAIVPWFFTILIGTFAAFAYSQEKMAEGITLIIFTAFFFFLFILYGVLIQSLLYAASHQAASKGRRGIMSMFRNMRPMYWRVFRYDILGILITLPALLTILIGIYAQDITQTTRILLTIVGALWLLIYTKITLWVPAYIATNGVRTSITNSMRDVKKRRKHSMRVFGGVLLMEIVTAIIYLLLIANTLFTESFSVLGSVIGMETLRLLIVPTTFFPLFLANFNVTWTTGVSLYLVQGFILLLHLGFFMKATSFIVATHQQLLPVYKEKVVKKAAKKSVKKKATKSVKKKATKKTARKKVKKTTKKKATKKRR